MNKYDELIQKMINTDINKVDVDKKHCKVCGQLKKRILDGQYDYKNKRWVDEEGKHWSGRVCPDCHNSRTKNNMKTLRKQRNDK